MNDKKDILEWFGNFRPDISVNEKFIEDLYNQFLESNERLSLDEKTFYGFVVSNYRSKTVDFIYSSLEENWEEIFEDWEDQDTTSFHIKNLLELIDLEDPDENPEKYPHLEFNEDNISKVYLELIEKYVLEQMVKLK